MRILIYRSEKWFRPRHLGIALRLQRFNSWLSHLSQSVANPDTRVLISMATFNGASWVESAIESVFDQLLTA